MMARRATIFRELGPGPLSVARVLAQERKGRTRLHQLTKQPASRREIGSLVNSLFHPVMGQVIVICREFEVQSRMTGRDQVVIDITRGSVVRWGRAHMASRTRMCALGEI